MTKDIMAIRQRMQASNDDNILSIEKQLSDEHLLYLWEVVSAVVDNTKDGKVDFKKASEQIPDAPAKDLPESLNLVSLDSTIKDISDELKS
tara:strand:+ start:185 stop:457 length:273 start_codon:yes stop_codon:yes gene_type:complete